MKRINPLKGFGLLLLKIHSTRVISLVNLIEITFPSFKIITLTSYRNEKCEQSTYLITYSIYHNHINPISPLLSSSYSLVHFDFHFNRK